MDVLGRFVSIVVLILTLFVMPVVTLADSHDSIVQPLVYQTVSEFVDGVCSQGIITQKNFLSFTSKLDGTSVIYDIEIVVGHETIVPVFGADNTVLGTKKVMEYYYTDEILKMVYQTDGIYELSSGDSVTITVKNKTPTLAQKLRTLVYNVPDVGTRILATSGGIVRNVES